MIADCVMSKEDSTILQTFVFLIVVVCGFVIAKQTGELWARAVMGGLFVNGLVVVACIMSRKESIKPLYVFYAVYMCAALIIRWICK